MPRFDGMGPLGQGPGTGWGRGPCGAGRGYGRDYGFRRFLNRTEERDMLKDEAGVLEQELKAIKERLAEIRTKK